MYPIQENNYQAKTMAKSLTWGQKALCFIPLVILSIYPGPDDVLRPSNKLSLRPKRTKCVVPTFRYIRISIPDATVCPEYYKLRTQNRTQKLFI